ncbi:MAG: glycosyltransferase family 1 protein [Uliginosibacterium sp.]|nr:glycosyltransferase family 1 protein [Uliginosibacterium sp.]
MAAATPAVSWLPQNRPECANLFKNGEEIELFSSPNELLLLLTKQANNYELRNLQTIAARKTLLKMHTSRHRINQYHEWIDKNIAPTFYLP